MERLSWIMWVGTHNQKDPYKKEARGSKSEKKL